MATFNIPENTEIQCSNVIAKVYRHRKIAVLTARSRSVPFTMHQSLVTRSQPALVARSVECPLLGTGGHSSIPGHNIELGLWLVVVSYHVRCLGYDTSVRQHFKCERWAHQLVATRHRYDMTEKLLKATQDERINKHYITRAPPGLRMAVTFPYAQPRFKGHYSSPAKILAR